MTLHEYIIHNHLDEAIEGYLAYMDGSEELQEIIDAHEAAITE